MGSAWVLHKKKKKRKSKTKHITRIQFTVIEVWEPDDHVFRSIISSKQYLVCFSIYGKEQPQHQLFFHAVTDILCTVGWDCGFTDLSIKHILEPWCLRCLFCLRNSFTKCNNYDHTLGKDRSEMGCCRTHLELCQSRWSDV